MKTYLDDQDLDNVTVELLEPNVPEETSNEYHEVIAMAGLDFHLVLLLVFESTNLWTVDVAPMPLNGLVVPWQQHGSLDDEILLDCDDCYFWNWIWVLVDIQMYFLNYNPRSFSIYILDYFLLFLDYLRGELNLFFVSLKIGNGKIKGKIVVCSQFSLETYILSVLSLQKLEHFHK